MGVLEINLEKILIKNNDAVPAGLSFLILNPLGIYLSNSGGKNILGVPNQTWNLSNFI
jgi:hypothetical protein